MKAKEKTELIRAIRSPHVLQFVKASFKENYCAYFKSHEEEVNEMLDNAFTLLKKAKVRSLIKIARTIHFEIFGKDDPLFWFNQMYFTYKKDIRPSKDFQLIGQYVQGKNVLDFGCGAGFLALEVARHGHKLITTDILHYRIPEAQNMPFYEMIDKTTVPIPSASIDTTIAKTVLHHINEDKIETVLKELRRLTCKHLIIEEDTYNIPPNLSGLKKKKRAQPLLAEFLRFSVEDQKRALILKDFFANAIVFGHLDINFPFTFRTIPEWEGIMRKNGFRLKKVILEGFEKEKLTTNCQAWLVFEAVEA